MVYVSIAIRIEQISSGVFRVKSRVAVPCLNRLERGGRIKAGVASDGETTDRAKYYLLTDSGRKALKDETREWAARFAAIARIMEA